MSPSLPRVDRCRVQVELLERIALGSREQQSRSFLVAPLPRFPVGVLIRETQKAKIQKGATGKTSVW